MATIAFTDSLPTLPVVHCTTLIVTLPPLGVGLHAKQPLSTARNPRRVQVRRETPQVELTAEEHRLHEAREGDRVANVGAVPQRTPVGDRAGGLLRRAVMRGTTSRTTRPDHARYRWGEDGIAGISDDKQRLCFALAMWNEHDPIIKERLFGLTNSEGNHGEDVKEYYFYVDNLPTHSYQRYLYKYPHAAFPYEESGQGQRAAFPGRTRIRTRRHRCVRRRPLLRRRGGVRQGGARRHLVLITVHNRGPVDAPIHLLPTLWFRNSWSWPPNEVRPSLAGGRPMSTGARRSGSTIRRSGQWHLDAEQGAELLFCENESNAQRLWGSANPTPFVKDGINDHVVGGDVRRGQSGRRRHEGRRACPLRRRRRVERDVPAPPRRRSGRPVRDAVRSGSTSSSPLRRSEADEFYEAITPPAVDDQQRAVMRQALAGMLWSKQCYYFDVDVWLQEHQAHPLRSPAHQGSRNEAWFHMVNHDVISMPDKWEYPWFAAWDLAFHTLPLMMVDPDFAKSQLDLMLSPSYLHPTGQIPAYEWNFSDVNPPVHALATLLVHRLDASLAGDEDIDLDFLKSSFAKLVMNFTWWVNRKDPSGRSVYEGGFLGLDNIGVFDRSSPLPTGGRLEQADGTAWMALFTQNMLELAMTLAAHDPTYDDFVVQFLQRFFWIAAAIDPVGDHPDEIWDDEEGFFYDVLRLPDGTGQRLKVRSLVGLLPICATTVISKETLARFPSLHSAVSDQLRRNQDLLGTIPDPLKPGVDGRHILSLVNEDKLRRILTRMLDERPVPRAARHPLGVTCPPRRAVRVRGRGERVPGAVRAGRVDIGHVRRQLELAWAGVAPDERDHRAGTCSSTTRTTATTSRSSVRPAPACR